MTATENTDLLKSLLNVSHSAKGQRWQQRPYAERHAALIAETLGVSLTVGQLLAGRGVTVDDAENFFRPSLRALMPDPASILDMTKGARRIIQALERREKIAVFGDYDVDGATSSALLNRYFRALGVQIIVYIPDRMVEGYGPNASAMQSLREQGVDLVITVDCGTLSFEPLAAAKQMGLDVIVVDHHKAEPALPDVAALINPNRLDDTSEQGQLAAVGVAFMLTVEINRLLRESGWFDNEKPEPDLRLLLDIVALGTVCDVVPLTGVNRALVTQGLKVMAQRRNAGITALADVGRVNEAPTTYHAGFVLGPRVNAGGRVGEANLGSKLLATEDTFEARAIAEKLDRYNQERRLIEADVLEAALMQVEAGIGISGKPDTIVIAAADGWHAGVIGIVASRLKDKYGLPSLVIAIENGEGKGSARSITGVDLGAAVIEAQHKGLLLKGGGHAMAAGLTVAADKVDELSAFLRDHMRSAVAKASANQALKIDSIISLSGATAALVDEVEQVGPFGAGNASPHFAIPEVDLIKADRVGENHLRCIFKSGDGKSIKAMAFRQADEPMGAILQTGIGRRFHIAGKLKKDTWAGGDKVEITLDDVALVGPA
ncbi:single-stranded-DNA-specific exonuclease RecJ [Kordiimonas aquimaris]|uniref:single-stranded-DNA-specific exonuclease RecJ n=1 Tax=Kordiimonas aquimaris TaxID=707591 RepID=UPI0021D2ED8A|nr:single-stranded-DNA-specific exonuclease RecJ [Kordiimonas aquimaris]